MPAPQKLHSTEYDVAASADEEQDGLYIDGYKVVFDQKVMTTPVEVVAVQGGDGAKQNQP